MVASLKKDLLQMSPGAMNELRKLYNFDGPGIEDAINILREWIQQQPHILKKDFSSKYLEASIILAKGSVERAKKSIDKRCTYKTLLPQFFGPYNIKESLNNIKNIAYGVILPKQTPNFSRVYICKLNGNKFNKDDFADYYRVSLTLTDYVSNFDCFNGLTIIFDFSEINLLDLMSAISWVHLKNFIQILIGSYAARLRGIYLITKSPALDTFISLLKPCLGKKIADRIKSMTSPEAVSNELPPHILPSEYGGTEGPILDIFEKWIALLTSEENLKVMSYMDRAETDESLRDNDIKFSEEYAGVSGTFRYLTVD